MEQLLADALQQVANHLLGNSIWEMDIHTIEGKLLAVGLACLLEGIVSKLSIVIVVVFNADAMLSGNLLKRLLGKDGHCGRVVKLEMHKTQLGVVVHKNGAVSVRFLVSAGGKNPTLVDSIWSTETVSPGLVARTTF